MIRAHVVVAAPLAGYAASPGRFHLVESALDLYQNRWCESVAAYMSASGRLLCSASIEGTIAGVAAAVAEFEVMVLHSDELRSIVDRAVRCMQTSFLLSDDEFDLTKSHVLAGMEIQVADLASRIDYSLARVMDFGEVPCIDDNMREVTVTTAAEFRRAMSLVFEFSNISWGYETSAVEYLPSFDLVSTTML
ncbi:hypothetical protein [Nocardia sp. NPDC051463]|uniref:hypothetical protein n=1 Tax=Nocardia sp. NPDC051463 TaxID=3154845 RepID=UPI003450AE75